MIKIGGKQNWILQVKKDIDSYNLAELTSINWAAKL